MQEVTIPLRSVKESEVGNPEDYLRIIQDEYAARFLELLGIAATPANKATVMRCKPLEDCEIHGIWAEDRSSAVADSIRIVPPLRQRLGDFDRLDENRSGRWAHWYGHAERICVKPPPVPGRTISSTYDMDEDADWGVAGAQAGAASGGGKHAAAPLPPPRRRASHSAAELAEELERIRKGGTKGGAGGRDTGQRAGVAGDSRLDNEQREIFKQELTMLKQKFIFPFACEQPGEDGRTDIVPWSPTAPLDLEVPREFLSEASKPIEVSFEDVRKSTLNWVNERLPLEMLSRRQDQDELKHVRDCLRDPDVSRLIGLLAHLMYWLTLGKNKAPGQMRLTDSALQSIFVGVHQLWSRFERCLRDSIIGVNLVLPCLMLTLKRGIERCLEVQYPNLIDDVLMNRKLVERINVMLMRLFDPDGQYARFGRGDGTGKAILLSRQLERQERHGLASQVTRKVGRMHRCTPLVRSLLGQTGGRGVAAAKVCDARTRAILARSDLQAPVRGNEAGPVQPPQDDERQRSLLKAAMYRLERRRELKGVLLGADASPAPSPSGLSARGGHGVAGGAGGGSGGAAAAAGGGGSLPPLSARSGGGSGGGVGGGGSTPRRRT